MGLAIELSGWDTAVLMLPLAILMAMAMFGLDESLAMPPRQRRRVFCRPEDEEQGTAMSDPDGSPIGWLAAHEHPGYSRAVSPSPSRVDATGGVGKGGKSAGEDHQPCRRT